ncbi:MAG: hypothetical protein WDW38_007358 [Sanguina aurantia]
MMHTQRSKLSGSSSSSSSSPIPSNHSILHQQHHHRILFPCRATGKQQSLSPLYGRAQLNSMRRGAEQARLENPTQMHPVLGGAARSQHRVRPQPQPQRCDSARGQHSHARPLSSRYQHGLQDLPKPSWLTEPDPGDAPRLPNSPHPQQQQQTLTSEHTSQHARQRQHQPSPPQQAEFHSPSAPTDPDPSSPHPSSPHPSPPSPDAHPRLSSSSGSSPASDLANRSLPGQSPAQALVGALSPAPPKPRKPRVTAQQRRELQTSAAAAGLDAGPSSHAPPIPAHLAEHARLLDEAMKPKVVVPLPPPELLTAPPRDVCIIDNGLKAVKVVQLLEAFYDLHKDGLNGVKDVIFACDTEVKLQDKHPIIDAFKGFFESDIPKVWHNYGFDRHVLGNLGIQCKGFAGDTMHMARLNDSSRRLTKNYGLASLTGDPDVMNFYDPSYAKQTRSRGGRQRQPSEENVIQPKVPMKELFGSFKVRSDGGNGKLRIMPEIHELHVNQTFRYSWIHYAALDARATWQLCTALRNALRKVTWEVEGFLQDRLLEAPRPVVAIAPPPQPQPFLPTAQPSFTEALLSTPLPTFSAPKLVSSKPFVISKANIAVAAERLQPASSARTLTTQTGVPSTTQTGGLATTTQTGGSMALSGGDRTLSAAKEGHVEVSAAAASSPPAARPQPKPETLFDFYQKYWVSYGEILTDMEHAGMLINRTHLREGTVQAEKDSKAAEQCFLDWAEDKVKGAKHMNPSSGSQIRALLFPEHQGVSTKAEREAKKAGLAVPAPKTQSRVFKITNDDFVNQQREYLELSKEEKAKRKRPVRQLDLELHGIWGKGVRGPLTPDTMTATDSASVGIAILRKLAGKPGRARTALMELEAAEAERAGLSSAAAAEAESRVDIHQDTALPHIQDEDDNDDVEGSGGSSREDSDDADSESAGDYNPQDHSSLEWNKSQLQWEEEMRKEEARAALQAEADAKGFGTLYAACDGGKNGLEACQAIEALCEVNAIEKLISSFLKPLQGNDIATSIGDGKYRVHCSLNINTETGRLSARRPNLQNQPSLEKDRYKVRKAFTADKGNTLVVADYGQLELRILAHMANCKSMLDAFEAGGDFHSRTAYGMYDHIKKEVDEDRCYLEYEGEGKPDKPVLKDKYASERRMAKVLNFSIAYGKTAHGLAKDFGTTKAEAEATVKRWYADRKEVEQWQADTIKLAKQNGYVTTLLGRTRILADINSTNWKDQKHHERAAINTPIQGSAADVVAAAMVAIARCPIIKAKNWTLLMQIHDEVILEGPEESAQEVRKLVMDHMENPWACSDFGMPAHITQPLRVIAEHVCEYMPRRPTILCRRQQNVCRLA